MKLGIGALILIGATPFVSAQTRSQAQDLPPTAYPSQLQQAGEPDASAVPARPDAQFTSQQSGSAGAQPVLPMAQRVAPSVNAQAVGDAANQ